MALPLAAEPPAQSAAARLGVSANVVSTCLIDSGVAAGGLDTYAALDVRCGLHDHPITETSPPRTVGTGATARTFAFATVNF